MVPLAWIEHATSPLPRECSTTELQGLKPLLQNLERREGIEPSSLAWKAKVLPLNYRRPACQSATTNCFCYVLVEGEGFEPSKAEPSDLQSDPFDRSGTPPTEPVIISKFGNSVNEYSIAAPRALEREISGEAP